MENFNLNNILNVDLKYTQLGYLQIAYFNSYLYVTWTLR